MEEEDYDYDYDYNSYDNYEENEGGEGIQAPLEVPQMLSNSQSQGDDHGHYNQQPYQILPLEKIYLELNNILEEVATIVYLEKGWCLLLLKEFKWDKDYLRQEYYNKMQFYLHSIGKREGLLSPDACFTELGNCDVCLSEGVSILSNICGHSYCTECWLCHLKGGISSGNPFLRCMWENCQAPLLMETAVLIFQKSGQGNHWLKKYEKKICELFITTNRNYQFCTGADCGNCIKINQSDVDTVACVCGKLFCFLCQSDDHYPCKCEQKTKWAQQVLAEEADAKWISSNAKICPWCKKAVERSMGCNFMACTCGKSFCYMCSQPWEPDHKDHFKCHIYKKRPDEIVNREKQIMERLNHCTERYIFNQAVANNYKEIDVFSKRKYLFKTLHIELTDSEFMETAFKFAIECCEKLKWIYAFTYFTDMKNRKETFQFSLGQYQKYKENLLKMLAVDLKQFMTEVQQREEKPKKFIQQQVLLKQKFKNLKKSIVNYYTCTKNYKQKFVEQLQQITQILDQQRDREEMKNYRPQNLGLKHSISNGSAKQQKKGMIDSILSWGKGNNKKKKGK